MRSAGTRGEALASARRLVEARRLIASPHGATLEELIEKFECSRTTALRVVRAIESMGAPVVTTTEGRRFRYRIEEREPAPKEKLTTAHVFAVAVAQAVLEFLTGTSIKEDFDEVVALLESKLAPKQFKELRRIRESVVVVPDGPWEQVDRSDVVNDLITSILRRERVSVTGPNADGGDRTFDFEPYAFVIWRYGMYTEGFSHFHNAVRTFGLDKLTDATWKAGDHFEIPESWDARGRHAGALGLFDGPEVTVRIAFTPVVARYIKRLQRLPGDKLEEQSDGRVILTMKVRNTIDLVNWVLGYGENAVVLEPASLRAELAKVTKRMAAAYG